MAQNKEEKLKKCFIITPIGEADSKTRRDTDGLIRVAINPVLEELKLESIVAHEIDDSGSVTQQIIEHLFEDDVAIANLSGSNPNVTYELALRHAFQLPVVTIIDEEDKPPFDLSGERAIPFKNDSLGHDELKPLLKKALQKVIGSSKIDNPVTRFTKFKMIKEQPETTDTQRYILERLESIETKLQTDESMSKLQPKWLYDAFASPPNDSFDFGRNFVQGESSANKINIASVTEALKRNKSEDEETSK